MLHAVHHGLIHTAVLLGLPVREEDLETSLLELLGGLEDAPVIVAAMLVRPPTMAQEAVVAPWAHGPCEAPRQLHLCFRPPRLLRQAGSEIQQRRQSLDSVRPSARGLLHGEVCHSFSRKACEDAVPAPIVLTHKVGFHRRRDHVGEALHQGKGSCANVAKAAVLHPIYETVREHDDCASAGLGGLRHKARLVRTRQGPCLALTTHAL
mmetsp:Transcript_63170/g.137348  ORF Transcript_63170/g.137348 Transcript_63170/m.137348 type:complete len:208 (-) Transcript_63170:956-1579(-)